MGFGMQRLLMSAGIAGSLLLVGSAANASTIDIGLSFNGGAIVDENTSSLTAFSFHGFTITASGTSTGVTNLVTGAAVNTAPNNTDVLRIFITATDNNANFQNNPFFFSDRVSRGSYTSVSVAGYLDDGNGKFVLSQLLGSDTWTDGLGHSNSASGLAASVSGLYSATLEYTIKGPSNDGGSVGAAPVPAALPLFGSVLGGGLLFSRLRKRKKA